MSLYELSSFSSLFFSLHPPLSCSHAASRRCLSPPSLSLPFHQPNSYFALSRPWNFFPSILMVFAGAAAATARTKGGNRRFGFLVGGAVAVVLPSASASASASLPPSPCSHLPPRSPSASVWHAALSSAAIALGSVVVNDYFDVPNDRINAPSKPLPSGQITVDGALLFGGSFYLSTLVAAAWLEPRELRLMVACSAAVTLAYTPVLKKIALVKTGAVAGVVALSPAAGALAVCARSFSVQRALPLP